MKHLAVITTLDDQGRARAIARALVERKLAACAQLSQIESFYAWKGAIENATEWRLLLKTTSQCWPALEQAIRELHPYELPAIHAVAFDRVHEAYGAWIDSSCAAD